MRAVLVLVPLLALCLPGLRWWRARHRGSVMLSLVVGTHEAEAETEPTNVRLLHGSDHPSTFGGSRREARTTHPAGSGEAVVPLPACAAVISLEERRARRPHRGDGTRAPLR